MQLRPKATDRLGGFSSIIQIEIPMIELFKKINFLEKFV